MADYLSRITYYLANMLPGAVLALAAYAGLYGWRRRRLERLRLNSGLRRAAAAGLVLTAAIECWQLTVGRAFDIDDLLLNTLGVMAGYLLWRLADRLLPRRLTRLWVKSD